MCVLRRVTAVVALAAASGAHAQLPSLPIKGVLESYFYSTRLDRGAVHKLTWGEFYAHPTNDTKILYSFGIYPGGHLTDEAYGSYEKDDLMVRVGRMRTNFGFNDWANLFYNGFNNLPLVRLSPLSDGIALTRQDSGIETTKSIGNLQVTLAAFDASLHRDQFTPDNVDTGIVRLQAPFGPFIVGLDALKRLRSDNGIYGFDLRYTAPHLIGRVEFFNGHRADDDSAGAGQGGYLDLQYRVPKLPRTQLVGRTEYLKPTGGDLIVRHTLGVRQIFCKFFQLNVNYSWGKNLLNEPAFPAGGVDNWSARGMFQIHF